MTTYRSCEGCGQKYPAVRKTSRFCSDSCRKRGQRRNPPANADEASLLVEAVRRELDDAGVLDTRLAQQALTLAGRVSNGVDTGASAAAASRELDRLLDKALVRERVKGTPLDDMRRRREAKAARQTRSGEAT